jgi:hypothetical protein
MINPPKTWTSNALNAKQNLALGAFVSLLSFPANIIHKYKPTKTPQYWENIAGWGDL